MNIKDVIKKVEKLYTMALAQKGATPLAVGWKSKEEQHLRFLKLLMIVNDKS